MTSPLPIISSDPCCVLWSDDDLKIKSCVPRQPEIRNPVVRVAGAKEIRFCGAIAMKGEAAVRAR
jgi:hypothetical protein